MWTQAPTSASNPPMSRPIFLSRFLAFRCLHPSDVHERLDKYEGLFQIQHLLLLDVKRDSCEMFAKGSSLTTWIYIILGIMTLNVTFSIAPLLALDFIHLEDSCPENVFSILNFKICLPLVVGLHVY